MATLILLRHGESQWNLENRFTGWVDVELSEKGKKEAEAAGKKLKDIRIDKVYTSVLKRAMNTAQIALDTAGKKNLPVERDKALNERHYGALQGLNKAETAKKYGDEQVHIWRRSYDIPPPADKTDMNPEGIGESLKDTAARTLPYFDTKIMKDLKDGKNVLVAAHGNSLRAIVMHLEKLTKEQVLELNLATGIPIVYEIDRNGSVTSKKILA
ncbi:MAG TPA: 2,3-diphosphoglycerate-dependent phosphoglycerate mutase [Verrucomicrobiae bacterium]|jgi:2,3-bisphosphoglycerate-dependent phosphoglycerate mutase|nr:2,3-diphosphoglycerate-dependent phosphoglycerate mutase [Verrucomicrobiae bacterium]